MHFLVQIQNDGLVFIQSNKDLWPKICQCPILHQPALVFIFLLSVSLILSLFLSLSSWMPMACPSSPSHWLPPNTGGLGQNNLYLLNKSLKTVMQCPAPSLLALFPPFPSALKGLVNVSKPHIRRSSQTINLKDTHRAPTGFFFPDFFCFCSVNT